MRKRKIHRLKEEEKKKEMSAERFVVIGRGGAVFDTAVRETGPLCGGEGGCRDQQDQLHE